MKRILAGAISALAIGVVATGGMVALSACGSGNATEVSAGNEQILGTDAAVAIAMANLGIKESEASQVSVLYNVDDGVPEYDIEFYYGNTEYDFEIHAKTGEIISKETHSGGYDPGQAAIAATDKTNAGAKDNQSQQAPQQSTQPSQQTQPAPQQTKTQQSQQSAQPSQQSQQTPQQSTQPSQQSQQVPQQSTQPSQQTQQSPQSNQSQQTPQQPVVQQPATQQPASNHTEPQQPAGDIGLDQAKAIALGRVPGASASNIIKAKRDYDDGIIEYEIEIVYGDMEYEFEINGSSGAIISFDQESVYD